MSTSSPAVRSAPPVAPAGQASGWSEAAPDWPDAEDDVLAAAAGQGDRGAFEVIVQRHGPAMLRYATRTLADRGDAEDAAQDALVAAWRGLPDFRGQARLRTWLFTLTARKAVDIARKRRPTPTDDDRMPLRSQRDGADISALQLALDDALTRLPWRQRACWVLYELEGLPYEEIAEVLATSPTVVRGQLTRARSELRQQLEGWR